MAPSFTPRSGRLLFVLAAVLAVVGLAPAAMLIESDRVLAAGDASLDGEEVTVSGAILTLEGDHQFAALALTAGATVRQAGGTTLTVDGALSLEGGSSLDAQGAGTGAMVEGAWAGAGVRIVAATVTLSADSVVSADGRGYAGSSGLGSPGAGPSGGDDYTGAGHGGRGGVPTSRTDDEREAAYGSAWEPVTLGSGGGAHNADHGGGAGGGAIHLVAGALVLDGELRADARNGAYHAGGGAGGSIWIEVGDFSGAGSISAKGGSEGSWGGGASGAGGRVAVHYTGTLDFEGSRARAAAGSGYPALSQAEHGTVAFYDRSGVSPDVHVFTTFTLPVTVPGTIGDMTLHGGTTRLLGGRTLEMDGTLTVEDSATLQVEGHHTREMVEGAWAGEGGTLVATAIVVHTGGHITANGHGYAGAPALGGTGAGPGGKTDYRGASHGGEGGVPDWSTEDDRAAAYGSAWEPIAPGSGGGGHSADVGGGAGGGVIHLQATSLSLEGRITADGVNGAYNAGGGAGGSIWIEVNDLSGSGTLTARGGSEGSSGGGASGAGGRIAVHYTGTLEFPGQNAEVAAGSGYPSLSQAEAGTAVIVDRSGAQPHVQIFTHCTFPAGILGPLGALTLHGGTTRLLGGNSLQASGRILVQDGATLQVECRGVRDQVDGIWVGEGATIQAPTIEVAAGGLISSDGQGYSGGPALGTGAAGPGGGSDHQGGGHGGSGGVPIDQDASLRAPGYGSFWEPVDPGSGGGAHDASTAGGAGGGAIHLVVDTLIVEGEISADGLHGYYHAGGGAGGSIWIEVSDFSGSGVLTASGGDEGHWGYAGSGAGGRIAVHHDGVLSFTGAAATASAGSAYPDFSRGDPGTVAFYDRSQEGRHVAVHQSFNLEAGLHHRFDSFTMGEGAAVVLGAAARLLVEGDLILGPNATLRVLCLDRNAAVEGSWIGTGGWVEADTLRLASGSVLTATGEGYVGIPGLPGQGPGGGPVGGGGAYGGVGGNGHVGTFAGIYGDETLPFALGSSGGGNSNLGHLPGHGGGALFIRARHLELEGTIAADGGAGRYSAGGGSGGAILVDAGIASGSGIISAQGGRGWDINWDTSGGGGGRVAIYHTGALDLAAENLDVDGGYGYPSSDHGKTGTVYSSDDPRFVWTIGPAGPQHGTVIARPMHLAHAGGALTVDVALAGENYSTSLAVGLDSGHDLEIDTTMVPDGVYELVATFIDSGASVVGEARISFGINNSDSWHTAPIASSETWESGTVHLVKGVLPIAGGATLTVSPGAVVKFLPEASLILEDGSALTALGTEAAPIIFTSAADDEAGGDSNRDFDLSGPAPGDWDAFEVYGLAVLNVNEHVRMDYSRSVHEGILAGNTTWEADAAHWIRSTVSVPAGVTLTIAPGAIVRFDALQSLLVEEGGTLHAVGTRAAPIVFTSGRDSFGGAAVPAGGALPAAGDWRSLLVRGTARLSHVHLRYGGGTGGGWEDTAMLKTEGSSADLAVEAGFLEESLFDGIGLWGGQASINNTVVAACDRGILVRGGTSLVTHGTLYRNRIGLHPHGGNSSWVNTIVAQSFERGLWNSGGITRFAYNNIWSPSGVNYHSLADPTGTEGNLSVDPGFRSAGSGGLQLDFASPMIDAGDGTVSSLTDATGAPRYDDPRSENAGIATAGGGYADLGAYEFVEGASSEVDLVVSSVTGPAAVLAGESAVVEWTVRNVGTVPAIGPWTDAVGLMRAGGAGLLRPAGTVATGEGVVLQPRAELRVQGTVRVPGGEIGSYHWVVDANVGRAVFEGIHSANNRTLSNGLVSLDLRELPMGTELAATYGATGSSWFKLLPTAGEDVLVRVDSDGPEGAVSLQVGAGFAPAPGTASYRSPEWDSPDVSALVPSATVQTHYLRIVPGSALAGSPFSLGARVLDFSVTDVSPTRIHRTGPVTLEVHGGGFGSETSFFLVGPDSVVHGAQAQRVPDGSRAYATFDLGGAVPGIYDLRVGEAAANQVLSDAVEVIDGTPGQLQVELKVPEAMRSFSTDSIYVHFTNVGDTDVVAPFFMMEAEGYLNPWDGRNSTLPILPTSEGGTPGVVRPGESGSYHVILDSATGDAELTVGLTGTGIADPSRSMTWDALEDDLRPFFVPAGAWPAIFANFRALVGETFGEFNAALASEAAYLSELGIHGLDPEALVGVLMLKAGLAPMTLRHTEGSLGFGRFGWWEIAVRTDPDKGHVCLNHAGRIRLFQRVEGDYVRVTESGPDGSEVTYYEPSEFAEFRAQPGDSGTLTVAGDGTYRLTEINGTVFSFDAAGRWSRAETADGEAIAAIYQDGHLVRIDLPGGEALTFELDARGRVQRMHEPGGTTVDYGYDAAGDHVTSITDFVGTIGYSYVSGRGAVLEHAIETITTANGGVLRMEYAPDGTITGVRAPSERNDLSFVHHPDGSVEMIPGDGERLRSYHDHFGNPARVVAEDGSEFRLAYDQDQRLVRMTGPDGYQVNQRYDPTGRLLAVTNSQGETIRYEYGGDEGLLTGAADPKGNMVRFDYDDEGRVSALRHPDGSEVRGRYDAAGRLKQSTNARGQTIDYRWDGFGRLARVELADGTFTAYTWDERSNLIVAEDAAGRTEMEYNATGNLTRIDYPDGKWIAYEYDGDGRRIRLQTHAGLDLRYDYGVHDELTRIRDGETSVLMDLDYDTHGHLTSSQAAGGAVTEFQWLPNGKTESVVHRDSSGAVLESYHCLYDALGRLVTMETEAGDWSYHHDAAGRLTRASSPEGRVLVYAYDAAGNRRSVTDNGEEEAYLSNRLNQYSKVGDRDLQWDVDGNLVREEGATETHYTYDAFDRLVGVTDPDGSWQFEYDALGHRTAVIHNGVRTEYLFDPTGPGSVLGEFDGGGDLVAHYAGPAGPIARLGAGGERHFFAYDPRGNTAFLTEGDGTVANSYRYLPFGEVEGSSETVSTPFRFGGAFGLMQDVSGLVYARARFHAPHLGRFLSRDALPPLGTNLYCYAANDPANFTDVTGMSPGLIEGLKWVDWFGQWGVEAHFDELGKYRQKWEKDWPLQAVQMPLKALNWIFGDGAKLLGHTERLARLRFMADFHRKLGNFQEWRDFTRLAQHQAQAGNFISKAGKVFGKAAGILSAGLAYRDYFNTVMKYGDGGASGWDVLHDGGVFVGSVIGIYSPPLGALFGAWDWATYNVAQKVFELWPNLGSSWFQDTDRIGSHDPNDIAGPAGAGPEGWILPTVMNYRIRFENDAALATAAAQVVRITLPLDEELDWSTFRIGEIGFGELAYAAPSGLSSWSTRVDARQELGLDVDLSCAFDAATGLVTWTLTSIDPDSGRLTRDPWAGFLPPNVTPPEGDGYVTFSVEPRAGVPLDTIVLAQAEIVFDTNEPIATNVHRNTIDPVLPSCAVTALADREGSSFLLQWGGSDPGAGLATYDVYVSDDGGPFHRWLDDVPGTSASFTGEIGHRYAFEVVGTDRAGNVERAFATSEGETLVIGEGKGYTLWQSEHFDPAELSDETLEEVLWGDGADPDHDGYRNLLEYFMGTDPRSPDPGGYIRGETTPTHFILRYRHSLLAPLVEGLPEASPDLRTWTMEGIADQQSQSGLDVEEREAAIPVTEETHFLRIRLHR